ncbi:MAG: alpha/beta fold hydrolase [Candidatus Puniceispirillales bacterium]|jgi:pimeloyl-ACP methyl ester carboxylesterase
MIDLLDPIIKSDKVEISTGLNVHYLEASKNNYNVSKKPTALLLHGFPELSFSWRKIIPVLAKEGFRVIAPDMRGYGLTTGGNKHYSEDISEYRLLSLATDILSLLSALKIKKIDLLVGHDAGSSVAGLSALIRPDIFKSVAMMSAPYTGAPKIESNLLYEDPIHKDLENLNPPRKHYQWYYSTPEANADMHLDKRSLHKFLRAYYHMKSADWKENNPYELGKWTAQNLAKMPEYYIMKLNHTMVEAVMSEFPKNNNYENWLNDIELEVYSNSFFKNSFQPALNWYRCMTSPFQNNDLRVFSNKKIEVPSCFIAGEKDWGIFQKPGALDIMENDLCINYCGRHILKNAGHWVQQENPDDVSKTLLNFFENQ